MTLECTSQAFFEAKYRDNPDPWSFASAPAELFRYDSIVQALENRRFHDAFEPACSVGVLTQRLAHICDQVLAFDLSETAVTYAKERCASLSNVDIRLASINDLTPGPEVDLLVLSELGYYFSSLEWNHLLSRLILPLRPGTTVLAAHWLGHSTDHTIHGDEVHYILRSHSLLKLEHEERHENFRLDKLVRA